MVLPSNLTPTPRDGEIEVKMREQGQQVLDFASSFSCRIWPAASSATVMIERYPTFQRIKW